MRSRMKFQISLTLFLYSINIRNNGSIILLPIQILLVNCYFSNLCFKSNDACHDANFATRKLSRFLSFLFFIIFFKHIFINFYFHFFQNKFSIHWRTLNFEPNTDQKIITQFGKERERNKKKSNKNRQKSLFFFFSIKGWVGELGTWNILHIIMSLQFFFFVFVVFIR